MAKLKGAPAGRPAPAPPPARAAVEENGLMVNFTAARVRPRSAEMRGRIVRIIMLPPPLESEKIQRRK